MDSFFFLDFSLAWNLRTAFLFGFHFCIFYQGVSLWQIPVKHCLRLYLFWFFEFFSPWVKNSKSQSLLVISSAFGFDLLLWCTKDLHTTDSSLIPIWIITVGLNHEYKPSRGNSTFIQYRAHHWCCFKPGSHHGMTWASLSTTRVCSIKTGSGNHRDPTTSSVSSNHTAGCWVSAPGSTNTFHPWSEKLWYPPASSWKVWWKP